MAIKTNELFSYLSLTNFETTISYLILHLNFNVNIILWDWWGKGRPWLKSPYLISIMTVLLQFHEDTLRNRYALTFYSAS